jgi:hypothetical protein
MLVGPDDPLANEETPPERGFFSRCAEEDSNLHGLLAHKALNPARDCSLRLGRVLEPNVSSVEHTVDASDGMDVARVVATSPWVTAQGPPLSSAGGRLLEVLWFTSSKTFVSSGAERSLSFRCAVAPRT